MDVIAVLFALKVSDAAKEWNGKRLFENASLDVAAGERVALIGRNGVGKTSFIQGVLGLSEFEEGVIQRFVPLDSWGWIEQEVQVKEDMSLFDFVYSALKTCYELKRDINRLQSRLESDSEDRELTDEYLKQIDRYASINGYESEAEVETALKRLGFNASHFPIPYKHLSGGQKTQAQFAKISVAKPQFLLLDEPTNHLDVKTLDWLEKWLKSYEGSVLFVSHDRYFIDAVANTTYELTAKGTRHYAGGYTAFRSARDLEIQTQLALYEKQQRRRQSLLEAIQRYKEWYERAHNAASERDPVAKKKAQKHATRFKAKERELNRLDKSSVQRPREQPRVDVAFEKRAFDGKTLVQLENVDFSYPGLEVFRNIRLDVRKGDRIGVIGPNGAGKSTLLGIVAGTRKPQSGKVTYHPQTRIGFFAQELNHLNLSDKVLDTVLKLPNMTETYARTALAGFLFRKEDVFRRISELSMGERCRVALVNLYFSNANLLVLDEPTNYLDIDTRERLEEALLAYPGALIVVSHDRYLLRKLVNRIIYFEHGTVHIFDGGMDEFVLKTRLDSSDTEADNEIARLKLSLAQLMSAEVEGWQEKEPLLNEIRRIQARLQALQRRIKK